MKLLIQHNYKDKRKAEYPSIEDQLDALWKGGAARTEMEARILAIKKKHPETKGK